MGVAEVHPHPQGGKARDVCPHPRTAAGPLFRAQDGAGQSDLRKQNKVTAKDGLAPALQAPGAAPEVAWTNKPTSIHIRLQATGSYGTRPALLTICVLDADGHSPLRWQGLNRTVVRTPRTGAGRYTHLQVTAATLALAWLPNADLADRELAYLPRMTASSQELISQEAARVAWHPWSSVPCLYPLPQPCPEPWVAASFLPSWLLVPSHSHCKTCSSPRAPPSTPTATTPRGQHEGQECPAPFRTHLDSQGQARDRPMLRCPSPAPIRPFRTHLDSQVGQC